MNPRPVNATGTEPPMMHKPPAAAIIVCLASMLASCDVGTPGHATPPPDAPRPAPSVSDTHPTATPQKAGPMVQVSVFNKAGELVGPIDVPAVVKTDEQWKQELTPEQFRILRKDGTEAPFCGTLLDNKKQGVYTCAGCKLPLFTSETKFQSGTGWPSFYAPIAGPNITEIVDRSHGMVRTEIECARCGGHLGHVFDDGPRPTGLRYCLNSESLGFTAIEEVASLAEVGE